MSDQRSTPFSKTPAPEAASAAPAPAMPPKRTPSTDPTDAPARVALNWLILCGGLGAILLLGGMLL